MTVDVERLASYWLRHQDPVTDLVDQRVYTEIPKEPTFPLVRLTLLDDRPVFERPRHLTNTLLQIDVYGGPKVLARQIADTVADELTANFPGAHEGGVISAASCSMRYLPDGSYEPAKPRYVLSVTIHSHP